MNFRKQWVEGKHLKNSTWRCERSTKTWNNISVSLNDKLKITSTNMKQEKRTVTVKGDMLTRTMKTMKVKSTISEASLANRRKGIIVTTETSSHLIKVIKKTQQGWIILQAMSKVPCMLFKRAKGKIKVSESAKVCSQIFNRWLSTTRRRRSTTTLCQDLMALQSAQTKLISSSWNNSSSQLLAT